MNSKTKVKEKLKKATVATVASASIITAAAFETPEDLLKKQNPITNEEIIEYGDTPKLKEEFKQSTVERMPLLLRALVGIPLWIIGTVILTLLKKAVALAMSPFVLFLLKWLLFALLILIIVCIIFKLLFPDLPVKTILNKKTVINVLVCALIYALGDKVLSLTWDKYAEYDWLITYIYGLSIVTILTVPVIKAKIKENSKPKVIIEDI